MGKIAFVFAGQGAQSVGMGEDLYQSNDAARAVFDAAGEDVKRLCFTGPIEQLNLTKYTQPCLFTVDYACAQALRASGLTPDGLAGFSLGEVPAAAFSGLLSFDDALAFVAQRGTAMHDCALANPGAMFAVLKLTDRVVETICANLSDAYPVNYNCPGQLVVACADRCADALQQAVKDAGGRSMKLQVSGAFHSPYMNAAATQLTDILKNIAFQPPTLPLYANATAQPYGDPRDLLARQVNSPVRWRQTIETMIADGFDTFIEVGPGKTLTGLIKKISADVSTHNVFDAASLTQTLSEVRPC